MLVEADNGGVTDTPLGNWLRKHGRVVRIPLTREQRLIAYETFAILDLDGSGHMDVEELQIAFEGLGVKLPLRQVAKLVKQVVIGRKQELGPEEFLQLLHRNPDLFGQTISIQLLASAHRRAENIQKLINKPRNKTFSDSQFKMPPIADLPRQRGMRNAKPEAVSTRPPPSLPSFFRAESGGIEWEGQSEDDPTNDDLGDSGSTMNHSQRGIIGGSEGQQRRLSETAHIAAQIRAFDIVCTDDLTPFRDSPLRGASRGELPAEFFEGVRRRRRVLNASADVRRYRAPSTEVEDEVKFLSGPVRGKMAALRGTRKTTMSPSKVNMIATSGSSLSLRMTTKLPQTSPLS